MSALRLWNSSNARYDLDLIQVTTLSRLRHPCILEIVEPMEETRNELVFATEHVQFSLAESITFHNGDSQLDEVETRKGLLQVSATLMQIARSLEFLHGSNRIHTNLTPSAVIINGKGDWKLAGMGYLTQLNTESSYSLPWVLENEAEGIPALLQRDMDYIDPMYALDHKASTANDMYSFGILIFAIFHKGMTPYQTHGNSNSLRFYSSRLHERIHSSTWDSLGPDLQCMSEPIPNSVILSNLITRTGEQRYSARQFQTLGYFNDLLVSVLTFMERDSFIARSRQEKIQFLRGLLKTLPRFSPALQQRKLLPSVSFSTNLDV